MNYIKQLNGFFDRLSADQRMTAYHISLYLALFQLWNLNRFQNPFPISRQDLMKISRLGSVNTYARCMKDLNRWGYIRYSPAANWRRGSHVTCIRFDTATDTVTDTATDTLFINYTNIYKRENQQNFKNGDRRKTNGISRLSVSNDKDYCEPL